MTVQSQTKHERVIVETRHALSLLSYKIPESKIQIMKKTKKTVDSSKKSGYFSKHHEKKANMDREILSNCPGIIPYVPGLSDPRGN